MALPPKPLGVPMGSQNQKLGPEVESSNGGERSRTLTDFDFPPKKWSSTISVPGFPRFLGIADLSLLLGTVMARGGAHPWDPTQEFSTGWAHGPVASGVDMANITIFHGEINDLNGHFR